MKTFLSYRRHDLLVVGIVRSLYERLGAHFGVDSVFMDVDTIPPGRDFREVLGHSVGQADVLLAVMGPQWIDLLEARRESSEDYVRAEIESAIARGIPVVPVLVGDAMVPTEAQLPPSLSNLASFQAFAIDPYKRFESDVARLIVELDRHYGGSPVAAPAPVVRTPPNRSRRPRRSASHPRGGGWGRLSVGVAAVVAIGMSAWAVLDGRLVDRIVVALGMGPVSHTFPSNYPVDAPDLSETSDPFAAGVPAAASFEGIAEREWQRRLARVADSERAMGVGRQSMIDGDFEGGLISFRAALDLIPDHPALSEWKSACARCYGDASLLLALQREEEGSIGEAILLVEEVLQPGVAPGSRAARRLKMRLGSLPLDAVDRDALSAKLALPIEQKLSRIVLPTVGFTDATVEEAIEFLRMKSVEFDTAERDPARKGVMILLADGAEAGTQRVSLQLVDVPLGEVLRYVTELAGLKYFVEPYSIRVVPLSASSPMVTRTYPFPAEALNRMETVIVGADPFAASPSNPTGLSLPTRASSVTGWLEGNGINFPEGSSAIYDSAKEQIILHHTPEIHGLVEELVRIVADDGGR